ncbi:DUF4377 domain-containing protein [Shewanella sp.]|uniref:DUF4377 domain-containing protein n=1 Tax=Shewanella sp. TaxID=50422 RepID=UPI00404819EF
MQSKFSFLFFVCLMFASACNNSDEKDASSYEQSTSIASYMQPCTGVNQKLCVLADGKLFYDEIEGFTYMWGYTYELTVEVNEDGSPSADASSKQYSLVSINSSVEDELGVEYVIDNVELLDSTIHMNDGEYFFLSQSFECEDTALCESLLNMNNSGGIVTITFKYMGNGVINLISWN